MSGEDRGDAPSLRESPSIEAEISRLRAMVARVSPVVLAALELRKMGLAMEAYHERFEERRANLEGVSRSWTAALLMETAYETALKDFDEKVRAAALSEFDEFLSSPSNRKDGSSKKDNHQ